MNLAAKSVSSCGYTISHNGMAAADEKVKAIAEFLTPSNITDLRSFMGLVNQLAEFTPNISQSAEVLCPLMSPRNTFIWTAEHNQAFLKTKEALVKPPVLAHFDISAPTVLQTDASRLNGRGYALLQEHNGIWRLIQCGSHFLQDVETRYSTIELEMLATVWAMKKCKYYLMGLQKFIHITDHRPLIPILNSYTLDCIENPRLQRLREKISGYVFTSKWRKGSELCIPDALSCSPVDAPTPEDSALDDETSICLYNVIDRNVATLTGDLVLEELRRAAAMDSTYQQLITFVEKGFPSRDNLSDDLLPYWKIRDKLCSDNNLVLNGATVVVPQTLHRQVLTRLHDSHRGIEATKRRAHQIVWWPGINSDIANTVRACEPCQVLLPSQQQEPYLIDNDQPTRPFESVSADFFSNAGKSFLVYADRFSGWPEVALCGTDTTTTQTIRFFPTFIRDLGVPVHLRTDGGPQFTSHEFADFLKRWGVEHDMSTPHYHQSNGHSESAVKSVKYLIMKTAPKGDINNSEAFERGLLEIRNTPRPDGRSPAQILYGKPLRSCVPAHAKSFAPEWQKSAVECDRKAAVKTQAAIKPYNTHSKPLPPVQLGTFVRIQDPVSKRWEKVSIVMGQGQTCDYLVKTAAGGVLWRNGRFLRAIPNPWDQEKLIEGNNSPTIHYPNPNKHHLKPRRSTRIANRSQDKLLNAKGRGKCRACMPPCI